MPAEYWRSMPNRIPARKILVNGRGFVRTLGLKIWEMENKKDVANNETIDRWNRLSAKAYRYPRYNSSSWNETIKKRMVKAIKLVNCWLEKRTVWIWIAPTNQMKTKTRLMRRMPRMNPFPCKRKLRDWIIPRFSLFLLSKRYSITIVAIAMAGK